MAAPTQTTQDKVGMSPVSVVSDEGVYGIRLGSVRIFIGTGTPHSEVTAPQGSLFIELGGPDLYMNIDGSNAWELVGSQT